MQLPHLYGIFMLDLFSLLSFDTLQVLMFVCPTTILRLIFYECCHLCFFYIITYNILFDIILFHLHFNVVSSYSCYAGNLYKIVTSSNILSCIYPYIFSSLFIMKIKFRNKLQLFVASYNRQLSSHINIIIFKQMIFISPERPKARAKKTGIVFVILV